MIQSGGRSERRCGVCVSATCEFSRTLVGIGKRRREIVRAGSVSPDYSPPSTQSEVRVPTWSSGIVWYVPSRQVIVSLSWLKTPSGES